MSDCQLEIYGFLSFVSADYTDIPIIFSIDDIESPEAYLHNLKEVMILSESKTEVPMVHVFGQSFIQQIPYRFGFLTIVEPYRPHRRTWYSLAHRLMIFQKIRHEKF